jgi:hypothetical protein
MKESAMKIYPIIMAIAISSPALAQQYHEAPPVIFTPPPPPVYVLGSIVGGLVSLPFQLLTGMFTAPQGPVPSCVGLDGTLVPCPPPYAEVPFRPSYVSPMHGPSKDHPSGNGCYGPDGQYWGYSDLNCRG